MTSLNATLTTLLASGTNHLTLKHCLLSDIPIGEDFLLVTTHSNIEPEHAVTTARIVDIVGDMYYLHFADGKYGVYFLDYYNRPNLHTQAARPDAPKLYHTYFYRVTDTQPPIIY